MTQKKAVKSINKYATPIRSMMRAGTDSEFAAEYKVMTATFDEQGQLLEEIKYFDSGEIEEIHQYEYDKNGRVTLHKISIPGEGIEESFITERDANGNPLKITKMYADEVGEITQYLYAENGKPVQVDQYDADGEHEHTEWVTYDDQSKAIKKVVKNHQEDTVSNYLFSYNDKPLLILQEEVDDKGNVLSRLTFDYDEEGREINSRQTNEANKKVAEVLTTYNELGKMIRRESHSFYIRISGYEYDEKGNLIEESLSDENGFVITRSRYVYDENDRPAEETLYETDLTRAGRDTHVVHRYEYTFLD